MTLGPLAVQDIGTGPVVVLLAGFGLDHQLWDGQVEHLQRTHRVLCIDLLGTGLSAKPSAGYSVDEQAQQVLETVRNIGVERFVLVGHSFGGIVAFAAAAARPDLVMGLVLVGSNGVRACRSDAFPFGSSAEKLLPYLESLERHDRIAGRRRTLAAGFAQKPESAVLDHLTSVFLKMPSWSAIAAFRHMYEADLIDRIQLVRMPVSILVGEHDRVHPPAGADWLRQQLASGRLEILPGSGHYPMYECPALLNELLVDCIHIAK